MELELLQYFVTTAEMEHITNAAAALHIAQPSLSLAINRLESFVGLPLFEKNGRGIKLTQYGKKYYDKIKLALSIISEANNSLASIKSELENFLTIQSPILFTFPGLMDKIMEYNPNIRFSHINASYADTISKLKNGALDFAICTTPYIEPALSYELLLIQEMTLFVGEQNSYYNKEEITIEEINKLPYIGPEADTLAMESMKQLMSELGIRPQGMSNAINTKDQLSAIANSCFVTLHPKHLIKTSARGMNIHALTIKDASPIYTNLYLLYYHSNQKQSVKEIRKIIVNHFKQM